MERHFVTVVFCDLCDSTSFAQKKDPEVVASVQSNVRRVAQGLAKRHNGVLNQHYGDGMLTIFGLPGPGENDVVHALEFTLELHKATQNLVSELEPGTSLNLHSGVDSGLIVVSQGTLASGVYEAYGDVLNTSARLSDSAASNEILVNSAAFGIAAEFFLTEAKAPLKLRGVRHSINAVSVIERTNTKSRFQASMKRGLTRFVGRVAQIEDLNGTAQKVRQGSFELASIVGSAGIGKTRLIEEWLKEYSREVDVVLRAVAEEGVGTAPLWPFLVMLKSQLPGSKLKFSEVTADMLFDYLNSIDAALLEHFQVLRAALSLDSLEDDQSSGSMHVLSALESWLKCLCSKYRVVLFVDDWQWVDDASRLLLGRLMHASLSKGLFLLSSRVLAPSDPADSGLVINLEPLENVESRQTIRRLVPNVIAPGTVSSIHRRAGGNPLFIEELCHFVLNQAPVHNTSQSPAADQERLPTSLSALIEMKVSQLSVLAIETAYAAAVVGSEIPLWVLKQLGVNTDVVQELYAQDLIYQKDTSMLLFKHGLTRDVVYSLVPYLKKIELHERVAKVLTIHAAKYSAAEPVEILAHHYVQSRNFQLSVKYSSLAGDKALATNTLDRARHHYQCGLEALEQLPKSVETNRNWLRLSPRWALACTYAPSQECVRVLLEAVTRAQEMDDTSGVAEAEYYLAWLHYALGSQHTSLKFSFRALKKAEMLGAHRLVAQLHACIGQSAAAACDYKIAHKMLDHAIEAKQGRKPGSSPPIGWAYAVSCKALVLADEGHFIKAHTLMSTALTRVHGSNQAIEASILNMHNTIRLWRGRWSEVLEDASQVQSLCERYSLPYIYASSRSSESYAHWMLHRDTSALVTLREATKQIEASEMQLYYSLNCGWLADILCMSGEYEEALEYAKAGLKYAELGDRAGEAMSLRVLFKIATLGKVQQLESPDAYLQQAYRAAARRRSRHETAVTLLHEARHQYSCGVNSQAYENAQQASREFVDMGMDWHADQARELSSVALLQTN